MFQAFAMHPCSQCLMQVASSAGAQQQAQYYLRLRSLHNLLCHMAQAVLQFVCVDALRL